MRRKANPMELLNRDKDTICALATAPGVGAISIVRVSGDDAVKIGRKLAAFLPEYPDSHRVYYGIIKDSVSEEPLDEVLISYFGKGRSFTGESTLEISCHGSPTIVDEILQSLIEAGARPAERGEFTFRAFQNGRVDLVQAESILAMIESRSKRAARMALRQLQGELSTKIRTLTSDLTTCLAHLEANIDFAAEDIEIASNESLIQRLLELKRSVIQLLRSYRQGRLIRGGVEALLVGRPNAGKSSLLNAFVQEDRAIVTELAGTTRDFVECETSLGGIRLSLVDSAGLRPTDDRVEKIGVERTVARFSDADLILYVVDAEEGITDSDRAFWDQLPWESTLVLVNKSDLNPAFNFEPPGGALGVLRVSARTGQGLNDWKTWIENWMSMELKEDSTVISNARHFRLLKQVQESLETAIPLLQADESPDLIALELQAGLQAFYDILGLTYDDQVMDRVFGEFCLGK
ncbi:MAG: tRNA uridine-5-carboxymethylaminomethyl(34) synthesis GTPase MnmE [Bdellovibrionales bacterium]